MASIVSKIFAVRKSNRLSRTPSTKGEKKSEEKKPNGVTCSTSSVDKNQRLCTSPKVCDVPQPVLRGESPTADIENSPVRVCRIPPSYPTPRSPDEDLRKVCRRILTTPSSTKRRSNENDSTPECSPKKSPKSEEKDITPKSSRRPTVNIGERSTPTVTPRRLFSSPEKKSHENPKSPSTTSSTSISPLKSPMRRLEIHRPDSKSYQVAKRSLHTAKPQQLVCREKEEREIDQFISSHLCQKTSGSMYISGAPGTGKTAVVSHIVDNLKVTQKSLQFSFINCMMLRDSNTVFCKLHEQLTGEPLKSKDALKAIEKLIISSKECTLLVLDEIDQLDSKHHEILYRIFEWPALKGSKIVLIGIANALDLTDRILPRLQASKKCQPTLMNFAPYSSTQITDILRCRLEQDSVIEPSAISFCAKKVAAVAGDMRKALDVCRRAVEMVETDFRSQQVLKPADCNSPKKNHQPQMVKKVKVTHISKVMSDVYGSSVSTAGSGENDVPLQQKLAVCSLLLLVKTGKVKEVTLGKLHESYAKVCKRQQTPSIDQGEFHSVLGLLESRGVVSLKKAKDTRSMKISLKLDEHELEQTLKDRVLVSAILKDGISK